MKALFVGDIHNHNYMFQDIETLDKKYNFDRIICMGDYVDDWNTDNHQSLETLERIFTLKNLDREKYTFLVGNHELSYLGYKCSGHMFELEDVMNLKLEEHIDDLDFYTTIQCGNYEYVCTHAGISNGFAKEFLGGNRYKEFLGNMNQYKKMNLYPLSKCSYLRGGRDEFSSFLWTDLREHRYFGYEEPIVPNQIVGHTPVQTIIMQKGIYFIDTHSTYRDGSEYGDKSYLMWLDNHFEPIWVDNNEIKQKERVDD